MPGGDADAVGPFFHRGAQFAQFAGHGGDAVGLFDTPAGDVAQGGGAIGVQGHGGQGHGRVGDVVAIEINRFEWPRAPLHLQPIGAAGDHRAHGLGGFSEADIALDRVQTNAFNFDAFLAIIARGYCA